MKVTWTMDNGVAITFDPTDNVQTAWAVNAVGLRFVTGDVVADDTPAAGRHDGDEGAATLQLSDAVLGYEGSFYLTTPDGEVCGVYGLDVDKAEQLSKMTKKWIAAWVDLANRSHLTVIG